MSSLKLKTLFFYRGSIGGKRKERNEKTRKQPLALLKDRLKYQITSTLLLSSLQQNFGFSYYVNLRNAKRIPGNAYKKIKEESIIITQHYIISLRKASMEMHILETLF